LPMCLSFINVGNSSESPIPQDLKVRLNQVRVKGNLQAIEGLFQNLLERESHNSNSLKQLEEMLAIERTQDDELRASNKDGGRVSSEIAAKV